MASIAKHDAAVTRHLLLDNMQFSPLKQNWPHSSADECGQFF
jgi:hypothetical protein